MPLSKAQVARLRSLREKGNRESLGLFVVEGEKVVAELLTAGAPFTEVYVTPEARIDRADPRVSAVTPEEMARVSHFPSPSAALAVGTLRRESLKPGELGQGLTLALDGVQDAGNVGTLLRVADWFGFDRVLLSRDTADLFSQKVINASMGSFCRVRAVTADLAEALRDVPAQISILGCDLVGEPLERVDPMSDGVVVIGSEGRGLSPGVGGTIRRRVTIPRHGRAESLNAAVAAGIVCAWVRRGGAAASIG